MAKKYKVRLRYTMIQDRIVTAENPWHAQQKALENFDEDYLMDDHPSTVLEERDIVGEPVALLEKHGEQTEA